MNRDFTSCSCGLTARFLVLTRAGHVRVSSDESQIKGDITECVLKGGACLSDTDERMKRNEKLVEIEKSFNGI